VFLLWLWLTNLALLFGVEVDAEIERSRELQTGLPAERSLQLPVRDSRKIDKAEEKDDEDVRRGRAIREQATPDGEPRENRARR
jgi:membrane protein